MRGLTFALYREQQGGPPLWQETQNVVIDSQGRFTALLGAGTNGGLPVELFVAAESQWLGVQTDNSDDSEQDRMLLVSVPYALKAADADTLGGRPLTAFVMTDGLHSRYEKPGDNAVTGSVSSPLSNQDSGTPNTLPKYAGTGSTLTNSSITDDGTNVSATAEPVLIKTLNTVRKCDQFAGSNAGAKIAACIADLPSSG